MNSINCSLRNLFPSGILKVINGGFDSPFMESMLEIANQPILDFLTIETDVDTIVPSTAVTRSSLTLSSRRGHFYAEIINLAS